MRPLFVVLILTILLFGTFFVSCVSEKEPEPSPEPEPVVEQPVPEPEPEPLVEQPAPEPEPEPVAEPMEEVVVEEQPPEEEPAAEPEDFIVSEDMYEKTFTDIETLIAELNSIIEEENYEVWTTYLTKRYKSALEDPAELARISEEPILKKYNIKLSNLQDYFIYVVVPSRSDARLDDIVFVDESHVKAIMLINNRRSILYKLEKIDDKWKIGDF